MKLVPLSANNYVLSFIKFKSNPLDISKAKRKKHIKIMKWHIIQKK